MILTLEVRERDTRESPDKTRARGEVPAVFYGAKEKAVPVAVDGRVMAALWKQAGETTIVRLRGVGEEKDALIRDVQFHPVTGALLHADFYVLEKGKKIRIKIPLTFGGEAPAEKAGHILVKALHEIEIEVAPAELPHSLPVDLSKLENVGDHVLARDVALPKSATLITHGDEIVASVTEFKEEKIETPAPVAPAAVEGSAPGAAPAESDASKAE